MLLPNESNRPVSIESLEPRRLLASQIIGGELQILGTSKADNIRVYVDPKTPDQIAVVVNRTVEKFFVANYTSINLNSGGGNDRVQVEGSANRYNAPTRIYGSNGNDTIFGGQGVDRIYGGSGNDSINGGKGKDILYGEWNDDTLDGDEGDDYLSGGDGNDRLLGWIGRDYLYGDAGNDYIDSEDEETDRVDGGTGTDRAVADMILDRTFVSIETFVL